MDDQANRPHRKTKEKKKKKAHGGMVLPCSKGRITLIAIEEKNVKAFVVANPGRLQKEAVRSSDVS